MVRLRHTLAFALFAAYAPVATAAPAKPTASKPAVEPAAPANPAPGKLDPSKPEPATPGDPKTPPGTEPPPADEPPADEPPADEPPPEPSAGATVDPAAVAALQQDARALRDALFRPAVACRWWPRSSSPRASRCSCAATSSASTRSAT
ncbi:MAG: hypothetical protein U0168_28495 [Nannocystaceae bacterium]